MGNSDKSWGLHTETLILKRPHMGRKRVTWDSHFDLNLLVEPLCQAARKIHSPVTFFFLNRDVNSSVPNRQKGEMSGITAGFEMRPLSQCQHPPSIPWLWRSHRKTKLLFSEIIPWIFKGMILDCIILDL